MSDAPDPRVMRLADYAAAGVSEPSQPIEILSLEQLRQRSQATTWVVKHFIPADSLGLIFGASGAFKSFLALDLAMHVAHGIDWLGRKTRQGAVLIIAAEGGAGIWKRICAWHRERRIRWQDAPVHVITVPVDLLQDASAVRAAADAIGIAPQLVLVDTLSQTFSGEENSANEVASYLRELGLQLRACWQCAVVVVHHTGHMATERPRGSSALRANVDFMFGAFRDENEMMATMECAKQKDGEQPAPESFVLKVVELGRDDDGDAITSLVATQVSAAAALEAMKHESERGRGGRNSLFLSLALNGVEEKKLRTTFCEAVDGDANAKRQAYFRAKRWAMNAGVLEIARGVVIRLMD